MKTIVAHSFRGGTGKTNVISNLALTLAENGFRIGVLDLDVTHPSLHIAFGFGHQQLCPTLSEFLLGESVSTDIVHDISKLYPTDGKLFLIPSNLDEKVISKLLKDGFNLGELFRGLQEIEREFQLDFILIDTSPGLDDRTLLILGMANTLLILLRNDEADIRGTETLMRIVDKFKVPNRYLVPNMIDNKNSKKIKLELEKKFTENNVKISDPILYSRKLFIEHAPQVDRLFVYKYPHLMFSKSIMNLKEGLLKDLK